MGDRVRAGRPWSRLGIDATLVKLARRRGSIGGQRDGKAASPSVHGTKELAAEFGINRLTVSTHVRWFCPDHVATVASPRRWRQRLIEGVGFE
jgi:hypothetical protein